MIIYFEKKQLVNKGKAKKSAWEDFLAFFKEDLLTGKPTGADRSIVALMPCLCPAGRKKKFTFSLWGLHPGTGTAITRPTENHCGYSHHQTRPSLEFTLFLCKKQKKQISS